MLHAFLTGRVAAPQLSGHLRKMANWIDEERPAPQPKDDTTAEMREIYAHWQLVLSKTRSRFTPDRRSKVRARLRDGYPVADFKVAIDNIAASEWHRGENQHDREYVDLVLICQSASKLEGYRDMGGRAPSKGGTVSDQVEALRAEAADALKKGETDAYNRANQELRSITRSIRDGGRG